MLLLLLVAAVSAVVGVTAVVGQVQGAARQLDRESVVVATLRTALVDHEQAAHTLLSDKGGDRSAFVAQQQTITALFDQAEGVFPSRGGMRSTVVAAALSWQRGLRTFGLWGAQVSVLRGDHAVDNPTFGAASDDTRALLDGLEAPALAAMNRGLTQGSRLEELLIGLLVGVFGLAVTVTGYFRRRMDTDLLGPMLAMHQGVVTLRSGDYTHRLPVARLDELGELAAAFNDMAGALHDSHRDLTLRATHDPLTGLANRAALTEQLSRSFTSGANHRTRQESVLFIDVDDFKDVNDTLGHDGGDALLIQLAGRLTDCVRPQDLVVRLGGDEFAIVIFQDEAATAAVEVAGRILATLGAPFRIADASVNVAVSIGIAQRHRQTRDADELLRHADFAMYMAKGRGKNCYQLFDAEMHDGMTDRTALRRELAGAAAAGQLRLHFQPVAELRTGVVVGVEALVRWQHPTQGLLPPAQFIGLAEETGDIDAIGWWVLDTAARQLAAWHASNPHCSALWVSVNLSPLQLSRPASLARIRDILTGPGIPSGAIVLEVTETAVAADVDGAITALHALQDLGLRIAIDDFGTGFSSLSTLSRLPVDILKIDRSFVSGEDSTDHTTAMLEGIIGLADKLSLTVIAEGIETADQLQTLRQLGCPMGQGYHLSRPVTAETIGALLATGGLLYQPTPTTTP